MGLELSDFKPVDLGSRDEIISHFSRFPPLHSDYSFSTMFCWSDYMAYNYHIKDDSLLLMTECKGEVYFRPPHGPPAPDILEEVMDLAGRSDAQYNLSMAAPSMAEWIRKDFPDLKLLRHRDFADYVYLSGDLADLNGKRYLKIRNYLNKFTKENDFTVERISRVDFDEVRDFLERWCEQKGCGQEPLLKSENKAVKKALEHFFDLELGGLAIRIGTEVEAFSLFEPLDKDSAVIHFEKANQDFKGIYQAINNEAAKMIRDDFEFINRESDMGIEGLRKAKMKYRPHHMVDVYHVKRD